MGVYEDMSKVKSIGMILTEINETQVRREKIDLLRKNDHIAFRVFLRMMFDESIVWMLPEGAPEYTPNNQHDCEGVLYNEMRKMYLFMKGGNDALHPVRREKLFIQLLEAVTPEDAIAVVSMKDRKKIKGLNWKLVQEAFPDI